MPIKSPLIIFAAVVLAIGAGYAALNLLDPKPDQSTQATAGGPIVAVTVPTLSNAAKIGETGFNAKCAACHGVNAAGVDGVGPPLIHKIYEPSHHGDAAFMLAPQNGVRAHHWPFGDMAPVADVTLADIKSIIIYVREIQRANGIF
jgi:mono/diheme cytochrome c family protein